MKTELKKLAVCIAVMLTAASLFACAAITKKGTRCKRAPSPCSQYCWQHGGTTVAQRAAGVTAEEGRCKATSKAGTQCKRNAKFGSKYCWQHGGAAENDKADVPVRPSVIEPAPQTPSPKEAAAGGQCTAITKKGVRCTRKAQPRSAKCWQHAQ